MNLGQLLSGAGVVGQGWREEEDAQRRSREIELRVAELNRLERLRQEMLQAPMPEPVQLPNFIGPDAGVMPVQRVEPTQVASTPSLPTTPAAPVTPAPPPKTSSEKPQSQPPSTGASTAEYKDITGRLSAARLELNQLRGPWYLPTPAANRARIAQLEQEIAGLEQEYKQRVVPAARAEYQRVNPQYRHTNQIAKEVAAARRPPTPDLPDPQRLLSAMIQVESNGNPNAVSSRGAVGLMQVKPSTAMDPGPGIPNVFDFAQKMGVKVGERNAAEAARLLKDPAVGAAYGQQYMVAMLQRYNNNLEYALAAYNAGPTRIDKWLADGADFKKLPKETRAYIPKVLAALNQKATPAGALTTAAPAKPTAGLTIPGISTAQAATPVAEGPLRSEVSGASDFYLADPQSIPLDIQRAMQQRTEIERLAEMYRRAGMGSQFMQTRAQLMEIDNNMTYLQGMQGLQEFTLANDPRRLAAVWSQYAGVPVGIQPRTDGAFNIIVNGKRTKEGVSASEIAAAARSAFDQTYRQQKAAASAKYNEEQFKTQLEIQKNNAQQLAQMIREIAVQRTQGNTQLALEQLKQFRYDVKPTGASDGTVIITPPGSGVPYLYNPSGRTIEVDGVKITSNTAYPITGLPTYGGAKP